MPYLIDGHNLIPHVRGLNLQQLDDEQELVKRLDAYFQRQRKQAVLYFDHAQPGGSADMRRAFLQVHFVRPPAIADDAILQHLRKLGGEAKNWVMVSSDQEVRQGAERMGARTLASETFAALLENDSAGGPEKSQNLPEDLDYWLNLFKKH